MSRVPIDRTPTWRAMISAPQPEAVSAGADVLRTGGNAIDAAIACALVQGVVDPLMCGIGGFGMLHVHDSATGSARVFEGFGGCPLESQPDMWQDIALGDTTDGFGFVTKGFVNEAGAQSVTAPGLLKMLGQAHAQLGLTPWYDLVQPSVKVAESGWLVRPHVYTVFTQDERKYGRMNYGEKLALTEDGRRIYLQPDGSYKKPGQRIVNPDLAQTMRLIGRHGAQTMYDGSLAEHIIHDVRAGGGILCDRDLREFRVPEVEPLSIDYRGWRIDLPGPPAGGLLVAQILKIAEAFDLTSFGHNSAPYIRVLAEAMKVALRDKEAFIADPWFSDNPVQRLISDAYISDVANRIRAGEQFDLPRTRLGESRHTTHVSVVDSNGMVVSMTHTLGNPSGFIVKDTGFMLNGAMSLFDPVPGRAHSIFPGKRRYSSMAPTIVYDGQTPVCSLGAPGASWIGPAVAQVLINILDWGMNIQRAISEPRIAATSNAIDISNRIPMRVESELVAMGYQVRRSHLSYAFAGVHGVTMFNGNIQGGADPQRDGYAEGVA